MGILGSSLNQVMHDLQARYEPRKWNAGHILVVCAGYFDWWQNKMMTEFSVSGFRRSDLIFVTKSGYATEVEIKISVQDWNNDRNKGIERGPGKYISRFFYAIPETLENKIPSWVPEWAGIIVVYDGTPGHDRIKVLREAKRHKVEKIPDSYIREMEKNSYYRFWRSEMSRRRQRIQDENNRREIKEPEHAK